MKKLFFSILFIVLFQLTILSQSSSKNIEAKWTVMIYMNANNSLKDLAFDDYEEMAMVGSSDSINIVVQIDRGTIKKGCLANGPMRFLVKKNIPPCSQNQIKKSDSKCKNMGDIECLKEFISFSKENFPARNYGLIIYDHANNWKYKKGISKKDKRRLIKSYYNDLKESYEEFNRLNGFKSDYDIPSLNEFKEDVTVDRGNYTTFVRNESSKSINSSSITGLENKSFSFLGFDSCNVANIESLYALRNKSDYVIASQQKIIGKGWNYEKILSFIKNRPLVSTNGIVKFFIKNYEEESANYSNRTLSSVNTSKINFLIRSFNDLLKSIISNLNENPKILTREKLIELRKRCFGYGTFPTKSDWIDLLTFLKYLVNEINNETLSKKLLTLENTSFKEAVQFNFRSKNQKFNWNKKYNYGSHGLSIYLPKKLNFDYKKYGKEIDFNQDTEWSSFINNFNTINYLLTQNLKK